MTQAAKTINPVFAIIVTDDAGVDHKFRASNEREARAFIAEELLWESTARVQCKALAIDDAGSFASFHRAK